MDAIKSSLLRIVGYQLFGGERPKANADALKILDEAKAQTVFTSVFPFLQEDVLKNHPESFAELQEDYFRNLILNTNNLQEHRELHELMTSRDIPYVSIKGLSSAYYYPDSSLRDMGDVDFLVNINDFEKAKNAVLSAGFAVDHGDDEDSIHIAFTRDPMSVWEQHRSVNGIPGGVIGELIEKDINSAIGTARSAEYEGSVCMIPDKYHHGLIILLHMASHMTGEGIGLRHLCDWAVFVNSFTDDEFAVMFAEKLRSFGLWKYAQIMTSVCEEYLGIKRNRWAVNPQIDANLMSEVIEDILSGGNFGKKDLNRYREIKYISNRGERTVDDKNVVAQVARTLNQKVYSDYRFIDKHHILLPAGWIAEGVKYTGLLISGKRKSKGTSAMLKEAAKRKDIYSKMDLFESK